MARRTDLAVRRSRRSVRSPHACARRDRPPPADRVLDRFARRAQSRSTSAPTRARWGPTGPSATSPPPPWSCAGPRSTPSAASPRGCGSVRTSTWSGAWSSPAGASATSRRSPSPTPSRTAGATSLARRFRYGTSAAPLARRHPGRLAPVELRPRPLLARARAAGRAARPCRGHRGDVGGPPGPEGPTARDPGPSGLAVERRGRRLDGRGTRPGGHDRRAWPALLALAASGRRGRRAAAALLVAPPAVDWLRRRPDLDLPALGGRLGGRRRRLRGRGVDRVPPGAHARPPPAHPPWRPINREPACPPNLMRFRSARNPAHHLRVSDLLIPSIASS